MLLLHLNWLVKKHSTYRSPICLREAGTATSVFLAHTRLFPCNQVIPLESSQQDSYNIYTPSLHTEPHLTKGEDGPAFLSVHSTLHAACRGLREECRRNQCVLISYNPHRNSLVSQIVSALIKGPPSLVINQSFYSVQAALTGARTSYPVAS